MTDPRLEFRGLHVIIALVPKGTNSIPSMSPQKRFSENQFLFMVVPPSSGLPWPEFCLPEESGPSHGRKGIPGEVTPDGEVQIVGIPVSRDSWARHSSKESARDSDLPHFAKLVRFTRNRDVILRARIS